VLVVNDDSLVLGSLADVLHAAGIEVRTAQSAEEAAEILDAGFRPSVVLLDMQLGSGAADGEMLVEWLRGTPGLTRIPIVAISASPWRLRRVEDEVQATLEVPFSLDELERTLAEICAEAVA
jgi:two-component system, chemotaxis family, chemotaxis protein CheY